MKLISSFLFLFVFFNTSFASSNLCLEKIQKKYSAGEVSIQDSSFAGRSIVYNSKLNPLLKEDYLPLIKSGDAVVFTYHWSDETGANDDYFKIMIVNSKTCEELPYF